MALSGKVARLRWLCATAAALVVSTSVFASALSGNSSQWNPQLQSLVPDAVKPFLQPEYSLGAVPTQGWTLETQTPWKGSIFGGITGGDVYTNVYQAQDGSNHLLFEYWIDRSKATGQKGAISGVSLPGIWWQQTDILNVGVGPDAVHSGTGDPAWEWNNGRPYSIGCDAAAKTPAIVFRTSSFTTAAGPTLVGTLIGPGDSSAHVWFETSATSYMQDQMGVSSDTGLVGNANVLIPMPEPTSLILLGAAASLLVARRNKRG